MSYGLSCIPLNFLYYISLLSYFNRQSNKSCMSNTCLDQRSENCTQVQKCYPISSDQMFIFWIINVLRYSCLNTIWTWHSYLAILSKKKKKEVRITFFFSFWTVPEYGASSYYGMSSLMSVICRTIFFWILFE